MPAHSISDLLKVQIDLIGKWVERRLEELMGGEQDDIVINMIIGMLEQGQRDNLAGHSTYDPKYMQV